MGLQGSPGSFLRVNLPVGRYQAVKHLRHENLGIDQGCSNTSKVSQNLESVIVTADLPETIFKKSGKR